MPESRAKPEAEPAVSFSCLLEEELAEIEELRKKRQWKTNQSSSENHPAINPDQPSREAKPTEKQFVIADSDRTASRTLECEQHADSVFDRAHQASLVGLAFSGGGIRSATFNLGVLQGLAKLGLLPMFDYISTVSGGGYIGSWLCAWILRTGQDKTNGKCKETAPGNLLAPIQVVQEGLKPDRSTKTQHQEPRPIRFLREYSNYITPRLGVLGADTWTAVAIYVRNLFLNQLILVLFLASILLIPHIAAWISYWATESLNVSNFLAPITVFLLLLLALTVVAWNMKNLTGVHSETGTKFPWYAQLGWVLALVAAPLFLAAWIAGVSLMRLFTFFHCWWEWPALGIAVFGVVWVFASLWNMPDRGPAAPHWSSTAAWGWSIFFSLISGAVGGILLWVLASAEINLNGNHPEAAMWLVVSFGTPLVVVIFLIVGALQIGLIGLYFPDPRREWWARLGGYLLIISIVWAVAFALAIYSPLGLMLLKGWLKKTLKITWVVSTLAGIFGGKSKATGGLDSRTWKDVALSITPYIFIVGIASMIAWLLQVSLAALDHQQYWLLILFVAFLAVCVFLSMRVNLNEFSMNLFYRNRLVRAYLGASHPNRMPNPFTGFDPHDELQLKELRSGQCYSGPFPIINTALNVVSGKDLAWQERKAESFVLTPLRCGFDTWLEQIDLEDENSPTQRSPDIQKYGYRPTEHFGFSDVGLRLGTAVSISGAAASPNMGYHSSPALAFLMTIFNVRLGYWAGNPRHNSSWMNPGPRVGLLYLLAELFGQTNDEARYVYLSDGGHFENLALYELVKRRCKFIIVCDADCDSAYAFGDIGNAIRKCREDIGVEIDLKFGKLTPSPLAPAQLASGIPAVSKWHWAIGKIHYNLVDPGAEDGILVYLKTSMTGDEPPDVVNYQRQHPDFPHQTTADQWFAESQFESYRRLGQHVVEQLFEPVETVVSQLPSVPSQSFARNIFEGLHAHWKS
jgi:Patatin-like phospholipase